MDIVKAFIYNLTAKIHLFNNKIEYNIYLFI